MIKKNKFEIIATLFAIIFASVSPLSLTASATGIESLSWFGTHTILPAVILWALVALIAKKMHWSNLTKTVKLSIIFGIIGTVSMEIVRSIGFRYFHGMPGSLPMLMGVQLTNQFMSGPNWWSNLIGFSDHFWNGISFTFIYIALFGRGKLWLAILYVLSIATIFMLSPMMNVLGVGLFGHQFAEIRFPLTVYAAHIAWGLTFGILLMKAKVTPEQPLFAIFKDLITKNKKSQ
jgi:hypothetical protein